MKLEAVIRKSATSFLLKGMIMKINPQCQTQCKINTDGNLFKEAQNKLKPEQKENIMNKERTMLKIGVIQPSLPPYASQKLLVKNWMVQTDHVWTS